MDARALVRERWRDLKASVVTMPGRAAWGRCLLVYAAFVACALPIGLASGVVRLSVAPHSPAATVVIALTVLAHPAFIEEALFRGILVPRRLRSFPTGRMLVVAGIALAAYIASHPLNAILLRPSALPVFTNPAYLFLAALLGVACTAVYAISESLWPSVLLHWLTAVAWILLLGGQALLNDR